MSLTWKEVFSYATIEASKAHRRLGYDFRRQNSIDVFSAIESDNVVLMFQPLGNLAGAYIPASSENPPGILINEKLPLARQRFSAAHEYCHHLRKDSASLDTEDEMFSVDNYKKDDKEKIAETFAAAFLMPKPILIQLIHELEINSRSIGSVDVYNLSLRLGCSYLATANQLRATKIITDSDYKKLHAVRPRKIKEELGTEGLVSSWNDVWTIRPKNHGSAIRPNVGDAIRICLTENATTGYIWDARVESVHENDNRMDGVLDIFENHHAGESKLVGGNGRRTFVFQATQSGEVIVKLSHLRPWDPQDCTESLQVKVCVQTKRHGVHINMLTG